MSRNRASPPLPRYPLALNSPFVRKRPFLERRARFMVVFSHFTRTFFALSDLHDTLLRCNSRIHAGINVRNETIARPWYATFSESRDSDSAVSSFLPVASSHASRHCAKNSACSSRLSIPAPMRSPSTSSIPALSVARVTTFGTPNLIPGICTMPTRGPISSINLRPRSCARSLSSSGPRLPRAVGNRSATSDRSTFF